MEPDFVLHLEIVLRSLVLGELLLFCVAWWRWPLHAREGSLLAVAICTAGYMFLAMPVLAPESGFLRGLVLALTDALPYAVWLAGMFWLKDEFHPRWLGIVIAAWAVWHVYFFGVMHGQGTYHGISHVVAILLMLHLVFMAVAELGDDLVESRRKLRVLASIVASLVIIFIAAGQLAADRLDRDIQEFVSTVVVFLSVTLATALLLRGAWPRPLPLGKPVSREPADMLPPRAAQLWQRLDEFMAAGGYRQSGLGIKALASQLDCPEHQLRKLINGHLGYRNFSTFLNAHRIKEARERLQAPEHEPVLGIALDLGYGSLGPFNRAFKAATGLTPTEYRQSARNRR